MIQNIDTQELHCSKCGSTDPEDLYSGDDGYSACCNKRVTRDN